jgi:hypothetical protein
VKATYHVQVFSGVEHGFTRGDPTVENIREYSVDYLLAVLEMFVLMIYFVDDDVGWARQQSAESIVAWFKRFIALQS